MEQSRSTPDSDPDSDGFAALLREVARPESVQLNAPHVPTTLAAVLPDVFPTAVREPKPAELLDGHYRVLRELGRGGMGVVFAAENVRTGKRVAIKWLLQRSEHSSEKQRALVSRFRREARAAAAIRHANVVDVFDVAGSDEAPYLVMELLEGESLRTLSKRGPLSWDEALAMVLPVLRGVQAAHDKGIVHRDLKPDNVFVCTTESGERIPKVLDFGVASMRDSSSDGMTSLTRTGSVLGTPSYMPLEQLKGEEVDARADVYALGTLLYELLTGQLPFSARGASELAVKQATEQPTPISRHVSSLTGAREAAVMKALSRKATDRYASAEEFAEALVGARKPHLSRRVLWTSVLLALSAAAATTWWAHETTHSAVSKPSHHVTPPTAAAVQAAPPKPALTPPLEVTPSPAVPPEPTAPAVQKQAPRRKRVPAAPVLPAAPKEPTNLSVDDF